MTDRRKRRKTKDDISYLQFLCEDDSTDESSATDNEVGTSNHQPVVDVGSFNEAQIQNVPSCEETVAPADVIHFSSDDYSDSTPDSETNSETVLTTQSESSDEETEPPAPGEQPTLRAQLATWQIRNHIEFSKCDELLKILNPFFVDLPLSTRTLVKTPRKAVILKTIQPGKYYHFGIEKGILDTLMLLKVSELLVDIVYLYVGIDGVLVKSSGSQFWPIVGYLPFLKNSPPFPIGVFHAFSKRTSSNAFLLDFISKAE
uniref:Uncharacterized protein n=1 Tax=Daphnia galeata TaxID=27404 RepID=A0A8J2RLL9_9CRUS|nr:unnamed protein product [Daphnia galeata]